MATALAIFSAAKAAFDVAPWLRTLVLVIAAFSFGFVKGCNTGRSWAKSPDPAKVEQPRPRIIPRLREDAEAAPKLPPIADAIAIPQQQPTAVQPKQVYQSRSCRRGLFGRIICN